MRSNTFLSSKPIIDELNAADQSLLTSCSRVRCNFSSISDECRTTRTQYTPVRDSSDDHVIETNRNVVENQFHRSHLVALTVYASIDRQLVIIVWYTYQIPVAG